MVRLACTAGFAADEQSGVHKSVWLADETEWEPLWARIEV